jgi:hypothetical protein
VIFSRSQREYIRHDRDGGDRGDCFWGSVVGLNSELGVIAIPGSITADLENSRGVAVVWLSLGGGADKYSWLSKENPARFTLEERK